MKKIIILLALISLFNVQSVFAVQESITLDTGSKMGEPTFSDLAKPLFKTKEQLDKEREIEAEERQKDYDERNPVTSVQTRVQSRSAMKPLKRVRLKIKDSITNRAIKRDKKRNPEKYEALEENTVKENLPPNKIVLECKTINYLADKREIQATGGVKVIFPEQQTEVTADKMTFNRTENVIKLIDNVVIARNGNTMYGDFIQIDMDEEISVIDNLKTNNYSIEMIAEKGYMYGDKTVEENGHLTVTRPYKIRMLGAISGLNQPLEIAEEDKITYEKMNPTNKYIIKSNHIILDSDEYIDKITLKKIEIYKNGKRILKLPSTTMYTNKTQDFVEGNYPEVGTRSGFGLFAGIGMVFKPIKGTTLKAMPLFNNNGGAGIGGMLRFNSASNRTEAFYGSAANRFSLIGRQDLDDNLYLQYGSNSYLDNGFVGSGWNKYAIEAIYDKENSFKGFIGEDRDLRFKQRFGLGYIQDGETSNSFDKYNTALYDKHKRKLEGTNLGTMRFNYQTETRQTLFSYKNYQTNNFLNFSIVGQTSASVYGTGDSQFILRGGPSLKYQYKNWSQELGYFIAGYNQDTPLALYDMYRYGHSNVYLREYIKIHNLIRVGWYGSLNLSDDAPDGRLFQECKFIVDLGPDDLRLQLGVDAVRQNTYIGFVVDVDAKGSEVYYNKMELKNTENLGQNADADNEEPTAFQPVSYSEDYETKKQKGKETTYQSDVKCEVVDIEDSSLRMENEKI